MVEDYAIHLETGRSVGTGYYEKTRNGPWVKVMKYQEMYKTDAGDFSPQEWRVRILKAIEDAGETTLLEEIKEYCRRHFRWLRNEDEVEGHAARCLANRAYLHWKEFSEEGHGIFFVG